MTRCLCDKAIDILDEAGSRVHLKNLKIPKNILEAEKALDIIKENKQAAQGFGIILTQRISGCLDRTGR